MDTASVESLTLCEHGHDMATRDGWPHLVVHDGVHKHRDTVPGQDLLRWYLVCQCPHVNLDIHIHAGDHEEDPGPRGAS